MFSGFEKWKSIGMVWWFWGVKSVQSPRAKISVVYTKNQSRTLGTSWSNKAFLKSHFLRDGTEVTGNLYRLPQKAVNRAVYLNYRYWPAWQSACLLLNAAMISSRKKHYFFKTKPFVLLWKSAASELILMKMVNHKHIFQHWRSFLGWQQLCPSYTNEIL